jgi:hypothetical protein
MFLQRSRTIDLCLVLAVCLIALLQILTVQRIESFGADSSIYMTLARNLRTLGRYEFNYLPHTVYPPGFPLLLALISALTGNAGYDAFIRWMPVFGGLGIITFYFVLRHVFSSPVSAASCILLATSAPYYQLATRTVNSDVVYLLMSAAALLCLLSLERPLSALTPVRHGLSILCCLWTTYAVLTRSVGIALCMAFATWVLFHIVIRHGPINSAARTAIAAAIFGFLASFIWLGWAHQAKVKVYASQQMESYESVFMAADPHRPDLGKVTIGGLIQRAVRNIPVHAAHIATIAFRIPYVFPAWFSPVAVIVLALLCVGCIQRLQSSTGTLLAWYFIFYYSAYVLWPFDEGPRFMIPVAPVAIALMWEGARYSFSILRKKPATVLAASAGISMCAAAVAWAAKDTRSMQAMVGMVLWPAAAMASCLLFFWARRDEGRRFQNLLDSGISSAGKYISICALLSVLLLMAAGVWQSTAYAYRNLAPDPRTFRHYPSVSASAWLNQASPGTVMAEQSAVVHRLTGRRVAPFPATHRPEVIAGVLLRERVRYLLVCDPLDHEYYYPSQTDRMRLLAASYPDAFHLAHQGSGYRLFEVNTSALDAH